MSKTVLITGAAGFIGSHIADACLRLGFEVVAIDDLSGGMLSNVPKSCEFIQGSVCDLEFIRRVFAERTFSFVYHFAAYAAEGLSHFIRHFNYETNLQGSMVLLNEAIKQEVECFVFASSIAVYGSAQLPMSEDTIPCPEDPYGVSKYAVELDLQAAHKVFGLNYIVFRPHNVYGERQNIADKYRNVIGIFMNQLMNDQPMTIYGDGTQTRAFSYIDDVAPTIARSPLIADARNHVFNIGADEPYTVMELAQKVAQAMGKECCVTHLNARNEVLHAFASHEKVRRLIGGGPPIELSEGLRRMADWAKRQGATVPVKFNNIEVTKNLPKSWGSSR